MYPGKIKATETVTNKHIHLRITEINKEGAYYL